MFAFHRAVHRFHGAPELMTFPICTAAVPVLPETFSAYDESLSFVLF